MRITAPDVRNELVINDSISGGQITLYYRIPTTQERVRYSQSLFRRERNKVVYSYSEARQHWGREILEGFKDGDFAVREKGKDVPYSSDPKVKNFREDWKELVCTYAADLVEFLAVTVFEGASRGVNLDFLSGGEEEVPDEASGKKS
jgi:hypothetical protein